MAVSVYKKFVFKVDDRVFKCLGSFEFSSTTSEIETTCTDSGDVQEFSPGLDSETLSGSGTIRKITGTDVNTEVSAFELYTLKKQRTTIDWLMGGSQTGDETIGGTFFLTNVTYTQGDQNSRPTFSFTGRVLTSSVGTIAAP